MTTEELEIEHLDILKVADYISFGEISIIDESEVSKEATKLSIQFTIDKLKEMERSRDLDGFLVISDYIRELEEIIKQLL